MVAEREQQTLRIALHNYGQCLLAGDGYDQRAAFRLVQLWLALGERLPWVNTALAPALSSAPAHKLLPLAYQCASRLGGGGGGEASAGGSEAGAAFQALLAALLERLCREHPFHALFHVLALKHGDRGRDGRPVRSGGTVRLTVDRERVDAAAALLRRLQVPESAVAPLVTQVRGAVVCGCGGWVGGGGGGREATPWRGACDDGVERRKTGDFFYGWRRLMARIPRLPDWVL